MLDVPAMKSEIRSPHLNAFKKSLFFPENSFPNPPFFSVSKCPLLFFHTAIQFL